MRGLWANKKLFRPWLSPNGGFKISDPKIWLTADVSAEASNAETDHVLNTPPEGYYVYSVLPIARGNMRVFFKLRQQLAGVHTDQPGPRLLKNRDGNEAEADVVIRANLKRTNVYISRSLADRGIVRSDEWVRKRRRRLAL